MEYNKNEFSHYSVMLDEVLYYLDIKEGAWYIDATFGAGGYTKAILNKGGNVIGLDQDLRVMQYVNDIKEKYKDQFIFKNLNFEHIDIAAKESGKNISGIVYDLGVSSMQLDDHKSGFSFNSDAFLDMRMGQTGITAAHYINNAKEEEISKILLEYGGEKMHRRVAKAIVEYRSNKEITTSLELAEIIRSVVKKSRVNPIDPATRSFQAIRIKINREIETFQESLKKSINIAQDRVVVVSFHSLEDKICKDIFKEATGPKTHINKYKKIQSETSEKFLLLTKKPIEPNLKETKENPRSRSAKLRAIKICEAHYE